MSQRQEERLDDLLVDWELARESGEPVSVESICADVPELAESLRERIEKLDASSWMLADQASAAFDTPHEETGRLSIDQTIDDFFHSLDNSGVLKREQLSAIRQEISRSSSTDPSEFADQLVHEGILTPYQARVILRGGNQPLLLDRYIILDAIGSGGMGLVFKALHRSMERIVAIKVLPEYAIGSPEKVKRFQREVKAAAKLLHPNVVTAYDAHEHNGSHFLVMEYVDGVNLMERVRDDGAMPWQAAVRVIDQVASGLSAAHAVDIIHRDIKPTNIMLAGDGTAKLLDLGIARTLQAARNVNETELTQAGLAMGTVAYMSPEQALDAKEANERSDIYSLGCTLCFLITGQAPFQRQTSVQTVIAHREVPPPSLGEAVPASLERVYQKMLAKHPDHRYQSVAELRAELAGKHSSVLSSVNLNTSTVFSSNQGHARWLHNKVLWAGFTLILITCLLLGVMNLGPDRDEDLMHRDLARWAITSGGFVVASTENGVQEFMETSDLPDGTFRITGLDLFADAEPFAMDPIFQLDTLTSLSLMNVKEIDFEKIGRMSKLQNLSLLSCRVVDEDLREIGKLTNLETLTISDCDVSDDGFVFLSDLKKLNFLDISATNLSGAGVRLLDSFPALQTIDLSQTVIQDEDLQAIPAGVFDLRIAWCNITDAGIKNLEHVSKLGVLDLQGTRITSTSMDSIARLHALTSLDLSDLDISSAGLAALLKLRSLSQLYLTGSVVSNEQIDVLCQLPELDFLDLAGTNLDDKGLLRLLSIKRLKHLMVEDTQVTKKGVGQFDQEHPQCILYVDEDLF